MRRQSSVANTLKRMMRETERGYTAVWTGTNPSGPKGGGAREVARRRRRLEQGKVTPAERYQGPYGAPLVTLT